MKSKKTLILVVVLLVLAAAAYFLTKTQSSKSTLIGEASDFQIADTAAIDKIFISTKDGRNQTLVRTGKGSWEINGKPARPEMTNMILTTLRRMEVKRPVSRSTRNNVVKTLAVKGIKVEVYQNGKLSKVFYTGGTTSDELGTYFIMRGSEDPYVLHIPGFQGFLDKRFDVYEWEWRKVPVFAGRPADIQKVSVTYPGNPQSSFEIEKTGDTYRMPGLPDADTTRIKKYLSFLTRVNGEYFFDDPKNHMLDSLNQVTPGAIVEVKYNDPARNNTIKIYPRPGDPDRMPAVTTRLKEPMSVQTFVFNKILLEKENFDRKKELIPFLKYDL